MEYRKIELRTVDSTLAKDDIVSTEGWEQRVLTRILDKVRIEETRDSSIMVPWFVLAKKLLDREREYNAVHPGGQSDENRLRLWASLLSQLVPLYAPVEDTPP